MVYHDGSMPQVIAANGSKTNGGYCLSISRAEQSRWRSCVAGCLGLAAGASICSDWRSMRCAELRFQGSGRKKRFVVRDFIDEDSLHGESLAQILSAEAQTASFR
ncbi:hypothetical protein CHARACLAT_030331 [Characodon lateralis]|uniref:Uncharacterized protein n=1 Tax=Characodon lateralis TaxID=208331 RepID=A0ABU7D1X7_9TELE|nr:hypothetical protein [Characodon lateralis]